MGFFDCSEDMLERAARRERAAARNDLWMVVLVLAAWSAAVALVLSTFGVAR